MFRTPLFSTALVVFALGCAAAEPDCADGTCNQRSAAAESDALRTADDGCDGLRAVIDDVSEACATSIEDVIAECRTAVDSLDERCDNAVAGIEAELADARARLGSLQDIYDRAVAAGDRATVARTAAAIDEVNAELRALLAELERVERSCDAAEDDLIERCDSALESLDARCDAAFQDIREAIEECTD